jgi:chromate transport protein ChrA
LKELWDLFWTFAKMGAVTFGGGYAMLPILQREVVEKRSWATEEEVMDYYAVGQCTPGIIAVNVATFIGQKLRGVSGGIIGVLPGLFGIAAFAPPIDEAGNSVKAQAAIKYIMDKTGFNVFESGNIRIDE